MDWRNSVVFPIIISRVFNRIFHSGTDTEARVIYERLSTRNSQRRASYHSNHHIINDSFHLEEYIREKGEAINSYAMDKDELSRIRGLLTRRYQASESKDSVCPICVEELRHGETVLAHPICHHNFHPECLESWLKHKAICPLCRRGARTGLMIEIKNHEESELGYIQL